MPDIHAELLIEAQNHHKDKATKAAKKTYGKLLELSPGHPIALNNLAAIHIEKGSCNAALKLLTKAVNDYPGYSDAITNLAICHGKLGQWRECLRWSAKAITLHAGTASAWLWKARAQASLGDGNAASKGLEEALQRDECSEIYPSKNRKDQRTILELLDNIATSIHGKRLFTQGINTAIATTGSQPNLLYWEALQNINQGEESTAIQGLMQVVRLEPSHAEAWLRLGMILKSQKNFFKAIACIKRSISENEKKAEAWQELTDCLIQNKAYREAIKQSAKARKYFPDNTNILLSHCHALLDGGKPGLALSFLNTFTKIYPQARDANLMNCTGLALLQQQAYDQAINTFRSATSLARADAGIWNNRGMAYGLARRGRPEVYCYRRAIACKPDDPGSHVNLAMAYLAQQDFSNGLHEYEWRLRSNGGSLNAPIRGRIAERGEQPEELIIICEQGLGDTFHFCRYLYDLRQKLPNSKLILACPEKLREILSNSFGMVDAVIGCEVTDLTTREHQYLPLMSLPYFCEIHPHRSIAPKTYLHIKEELRMKMRALIRKHTNPTAIVIGVNWRGNPETERSNLRGRSMALEQMRILADELPDAIFVSLQKGAGSEELEACSFRQRFIKNQDIVSKELCFCHTAAFCLACDYVLTTDTGLAHLAGAIGQRTKILLTTRPEWRWRGSKIQTPWYANTEVFYQQSPGHWKEPLLAAAQQISIKPADEHQTPGCVRAE